MIADPLKKLLICLAAGYLVTVVAFLLFPENSKEPSSSHSGRISSKRSQTVKKQAKELEHIEINQDKNTVKIAATPLKAFYRTGKVSAEWQPEPPQAGTGEFKAYYPNQQLWLQARFRDGKIQELKTYYPKGENWENYQYEGGLLSGTSKIYYAKQSEWIRLTFTKNQLSEPPQIFSENGQPIRLPTLSKENKTGYFKVLSPKGNLVTQWSQDEPSQAKSFYDSSTVSSEWQRGNEPVSYLRLYTSDQTLWKEFSFPDRKEMTFKTFYSGNGQPWSELFLMTLKKSCVLRVFYDGGKEWFDLILQGTPDMPPVSVFSEK